MKTTSSSPSSQTSRYGFTLVEILVALAVLSLLVVLVAQMVGSASVLTAGSHKRMDADDEARMVLDRMASDIHQMVRRPDISPLFVPNTGNDEFYFLSRAPGYFTNSNNSGLALVGYRVATNGLQRLAEGQSWDVLGFTNGPVSTNGVNETNYDTIAPSVFRMEYALLMKQGSTNTTNSIIGTNLSVNGANVYFKTNNAGQSMNDVAAIVVAVAILDQGSQKILSGDAATQLSKVAADMEDAVTNNMASGLIAGSTNNGIPIASWTSKALSTSEIPQAAARSQIRVYQRTFPLP